MFKLGVYSFPASSSIQAGGSLGIFLSLSKRLKFPLRSNYSFLSTLVCFLIHSLTPCLKLAASVNAMGILYRSPMFKIISIYYVNIARKTYFKHSVYELFALNVVINATIIIFLVVCENML